MLIQIHILQNYAPANLNRDDTGSPKDAMFGGVRRGRISSQCLKRSIRRSEVFGEAFRAAGLLAQRTQLLPMLIKKELEGLGAGEEELKAIVARLPEIGRESGKGNEEESEDDEAPAAGGTEPAGETKTKQLIFIAPNEIRPMAEGLLKAYRKLGAAGWKKSKMKDITKELAVTLPCSVDIAMFGRMTTSSAFEDVQAAVQVAHAISTNALAQEFDYYTAVDDLSGESGAGMIGDVEFNSSTYYKYLNVHWDQLLKNLGGDVQIARQAVLALLDAAARAQPTGKQNSFAAFNLPEIVFVEISQRNLPVSYANAFLKPVKSGYEQTVMEASIRQFGSYTEKLSKAYALEAERAFLAVDETTIQGAKCLPSLPDLQAWVLERLPEEG